MRINKSSLFSALTAVIFTGLLAFTCQAEEHFTQASPKASLRPPTRTAQYMRFLLKDGKTILVDPSGLAVPVKSDYGKMDIPVGALRALKFVADNEGENPSSVILRFHTGLIMRMELNSRKNYMRLHDINGKRHKIYYRDIMGVLSLTDFGAESPDRIPDSQALVYQLTRRDGTSEEITLPVTVIRLKTAIGTISVPTPAVLSIEYNPDSSKYIVKTVYGEIITCRISNKKITIESSNEADYIDLYIGEILQLKLVVAPVSVPDRWQIWYLKSGSALIGCFAENSGLTDTSGNALDCTSTLNITKTSSGQFISTPKAGRTRIYTPTSRRIPVALFSSGETVSIPWKDVCKVSCSKSISLQELNQALEDCDTEIPQPMDNQASSTPADTVKAPVDEAKDVSLKIKTLIGNIKLEKDIIAELKINTQAGRACVKTTDGCHFITSLPTKRQLTGLIGHDFEYPASNAFTITLNHTQRISPTGIATCRLTDGSILCGNLPEQTLTIATRGKNSVRKKDISAADVYSISRDEDGKFIFSLKRGRRPAEAKQKYFLFASAATSTTNKIPFKYVEYLDAMGVELPPTTVFKPGLPAELSNEILVKGGSFMQGSTNGIDDEMPVHPVSLDSFLIDATEVTRAQFAAFARASGYKTSAEKSESSINWRVTGFIQDMSDPVVCISWDDAVVYCNWRSSQVGLSPCYIINKDKSVETDLTADGYRLPTESEWEYAARSRGQNNLYACTIGTIEPAVLMANSRESSSVDKWKWTNPVRAFPPNQLGIYGMSGNAWEWCQDWYYAKAYEALQGRKVHNPCILLEDAPSLSHRVMRGGSFYNKRDRLRCTSRDNGLPFAFANRTGFRCVRNAPHL